VVIHVNQCGDARPRAADFGRGLLQARAGEVAHRLRAVGVAAPVHEAVEFGGELVVDGDGHALHGWLSPVANRAYHAPLRTWTRRTPADSLGAPISVPRPECPKQKTAAPTSTAAVPASATPRRHSQLKSSLTNSTRLCRPA